MKPIITLAAVLLAGLASFGATAERHGIVVASNCDVLNSATEELVLQDAQDFASDSTTIGPRSAAGAPRISADSVSLYRNNAACDSAEISYRAFRVARGDSNLVMPVTLARLGNTKLYLGTALTGSSTVYEREYALFDSTFAVRYVFAYR